MSQQSTSSAQKDIFELRKLWKMIQEMKQNDDLYHQCRRTMLHMLRNIVRQYIGRYVASDSSSVSLVGLTDQRFFYSGQQI